MKIAIPIARKSDLETVMPDFPSRLHTRPGAARQAKAHAPGWVWFRLGAAWKCGCDAHCAGGDDGRPAGGQMGACGRGRTEVPLPQCEGRLPLRGPGWTDPSHGRWWRRGPGASMQGAASAGRFIRPLPKGLRSLDRTQRQPKGPSRQESGLDARSLLQQAATECAQSQVRRRPGTS